MTSKKRSGARKHSNDSAAEVRNRYLMLHLRVGWLSLLLFLSLGIVLESLHAFRVQWYLAADEAEWRRLMWTLAHAHGVLIALVHVAFAASLSLVPAWTGPSLRLASGSLISAGLLMPTGFFLGGAFVHRSDPGMGVWLVPVGSALLFIGVLMTGLAVCRARITPTDDQDS